MKTKRITLKHIGMVLMSTLMLSATATLTGCSSDEEILNNPTPDTEKAGSFTFKLGGAAENGTTTRATSASLDTEKTVKTLYAALFTADDRLYKVFSTESQVGDRDETNKVAYDKIVKNTEGNYTIIPYYAGEYTAYFIANPSKELVDAIEALTPATSTIADFEALETKANADQTATSTFVMSSGRQTIEISADTPTTLPEPITLTRLAVRFDIVNSQSGDGTISNGAKITNVQVLNAATASAIATPTTMKTDNITTPEAISWESAESEKLTVYTYENVNAGTAADNATVIRVNYKLAGEDKTLDVFLKAENVALAAKRNTLFRINLNCMYGTYTLEVIDWNTGSTVNVHDNELAITYTEGNENFLGKIGDYVYTTTDGKLAFSDGGLRKMYLNGKLEWATARPQADPSKGTCVGIVFSNMTSNEDKAHGFTRGYVMGLKNASNNQAIQLSSLKKLPAGYPMAGILKDAVLSLNGYDNYQLLLTDEKNNNQGKYPSITALRDYPLSSPDGTSGWYIPTLGQYMTFVANMADMPTLMTTLKNSNFDLTITGKFYYLGKYIVNPLNAMFSGAGTYDTFEVGVNAMTCSVSCEKEESSILVYPCLQYNGGPVLNGGSVPITDKFFLRPVFAF